MPLKSRGMTNILVHLPINHISLYLLMNEDYQG